jgi:hypothetical protein
MFCTTMATAKNAGTGHHLCAVARMSTPSLSQGGRVSVRCQ